MGPPAPRMPPLGAVPGATGAAQEAVSGSTSASWPATVGCAPTVAVYGSGSVALVAPPATSTASSTDGLPVAAGGKVTRTFGPAGCARNRPPTSVIGAVQATVPAAAAWSVTVPVAGVVATVITFAAVMTGVAYGSVCPVADQRTLPVPRSAR